MLRFNCDDFKDFNIAADQAVKELGKISEIVLIHSPLDNNQIAFKLLHERFPKSLIGVSYFDINSIEELISNGFKPDIIYFINPINLLNFVLTIILLLLDTDL